MEYPSDEDECSDIPTVDEIFSDVLTADDKNEFISMMQDSFKRGINGCLQTKYCPPKILHLVCIHPAVNCLRALLEGEVGCLVDLTAPFHNGCFPLHYAAELMNPVLVELLLRHGAQTNVRTNGLHLRDGLLPLNVSLEKLRYHEYLVDWPLKGSIFKLITVLCLPQMKVALEVNRLLAQNTNETFEVLYNCARDGKLIEMATLLMVAREKLMAPVTFQSEDGFTLEGIMSLCRTIKEEYASLSLVEEEIKLLATGKHTKLVKLRKKKAAMISVLLLLEVFEKAGGDIEAYLQSERSDVSKDKVVQDVTSLLVKAGFVLKDKDTDLSYIECKEDHIEFAIKEYASQMHGLDIPKKPLIDTYEPERSLTRYFRHVVLFLRPTKQDTLAAMTTRFHARFHSERSLDNLVEERSRRAIEQWPRLPHPCKKLASFALAIKRGMRRL